MIDIDTNPLRQQLRQVMENKRSNLCLSADLTHSQQLLSLVDLLGPHLCMVKTHVDILEDFSYSFITQLVNLSNKHQFLIFEDRKFADIGSIVKKQYEQGPFRIIEWAHLVTAHILPGEGILQALEIATSNYPLRGVLLLAQMSSEGNFLDTAYTNHCISLAKRYPKLVTGFIAQGSIHADFLTFTPGVRKKTQCGALGQGYRSIEDIILKDHSDILIVGSGIYQHPNPLEETIIYQERGWQAFTHRRASLNAPT